MEKIPKSIEILGHKIKVVVRDDMGEDTGGFDVDKKLIEIERNKDREFMVDTLKHEIFHAVFRLSGIGWLWPKEQEEAVVRSLEYGLCRLFELKKNTKLIKY